MHMSKRGKKENKDVDEVERALREIALADADAVAVIEEACDRPSPRIHGSLTALTQPDCDFFFFGGEYYDGKRVHVYGDLYRLKLGNDGVVWTRISSKNSPKPRSAHQAIFHPQSRSLYLFGGEFTSPTQTHFNHFNDLWRLDTATAAWENLTAKTKGAAPSPRSGHRAALYQDKLFLFGGFYDTGKDVRYFDDAYLYDIPTRAWARIGEARKGAPPSSRPAQRSACAARAPPLLGANSASD